MKCFVREMSFEENDCQALFVCTGKVLFAKVTFMLGKVTVHGQKHLHLQNVLSGKVTVCVCQYIRFSMNLTGVSI